MPALKNKRHELYCQGIIEGKTSDKAYEDAGYVPHRPNASRLRTNDNVVTRIEELQGTALVKHGITVDRIMKEYERVAFSDIRELYDDEGRPLAPHELGDDAAAAVAGFEYTQITGDEGEVIGSVGKVKMINKTQPLNALSQMFGLIESEGGTRVTNNTQINFNVTDKEKVRVIAAAFAKAANE